MLMFAADTAMGSNGDTTMRINEQRNRLIDGIVDACTDLKYFRSAILRQMAAPYGDGSRSNMVNAETDVLPRLNDILDTLATTLEAISRDPDAEAKSRAPLKIDTTSIWWADGGDTTATGGRMGG